jgi:hypothetical protein
MQEYLWVITVAVAAVTLVTGGINIAKGKKQCVFRDEYQDNAKRVHERIDVCETRISSVERTQDVMGEKLDRLIVDSEGIKGIIKEMSEKVTRIDVLFGEFIKVKRGG